jgi:hypothetical protein
MMQAIITMLLSIIFYGILLWRSELKDSYKNIFSLVDCIFYSLSIWTGINNETINLNITAKVLTYLEAFNSYLSMAVFMALIIKQVGSDEKKSKKYITDLHTKVKFAKVPNPKTKTRSKVAKE